VSKERSPTPRTGSGLPRIAVLVSGTGTLLQALIDDAAASGAGYTVGAVLSDREGAAGLERARAVGVPTAVVAVKDFPDRAAWDEGLVRALDAFHPDLVVCAGFMRILGAPVLQRYGGRILNTHPALLPSFPGAHGVREALAYGVKVTGCSLILVDEGVDSGPIVAQRAVEVLPGDDEGVLHERIKVVERQMLVDVVGRMARSGWNVDDGKVTLGSGRPTPRASGGDGEGRVVLT
jgi:phosphoribosylglycinamide formyltransferase-1